MARVYFGYDDYGVDGVDAELIQFVFDVVVSLTGVPAESEAGLVIATDEHMQKLNRDYRGKDCSTNILTFTFSETAMPGLEEEKDYLGDVFISRTKLLSEAEEQKVSPKQRFVELFVHGLMHLSGRHHGSGAEAAKTEALEEEATRKVLEAE